LEDRYGLNLSENTEIALEDLGLEGE